ncbi:MAG: hypothetical protein WA432_00100 [Candidatus Babeliaceae bacterium]
MNNNKHQLAFKVSFMAGLLIQSLWLYTVSRQMALFYSEERIDNTLFVIRIEMNDGKRQQKWFINEKPVDELPYEEQFWQAKKIQLEKERQKEQEQNLQEYEFKVKSQRLIQQKLLKNVVIAIEQEMKKMRTHSLEAYYTFPCPKLFSKDHFDLLLKEVLPQAHILVNQEGVTNQELTEYYKQLEPYPVFLKEMFQATIENALQKCDDTMLLKELLVLVS